MKNLLLPIFMLMAVTIGAQQEVMYTQFMFNKMAHNPAYAGSFESPELTAVFRRQWAGLEGSPQTILLSYSQPILRNRVGIGGNLSRTSIGINRMITVDIDYAYRISLDRGVLSIGLQPSIRHFYQNWADPRIKPLQTNDGAIPTDADSKIVANAGVGVYYTGQNWYAGASMPRLIDNNIDFADASANLSREARHFNAMGGITFKFDVGNNDKLKLTPQTLVKYVKNAPLDVDLNTSAWLNDKYYAGLTYRTGGDTNGAGESVDVLLGLQATPKLFFCLAYDIGFSRLARLSNGSFEFTGRWWFNPPEGTGTVSPIPY
ncbi:MAG: type IX secretion system membrane protein PorP/SprF [Saprospiraceae bacterium]|nr:type IX secretion system membrane protein PorP/SprF [Saprospiraceae bacterium]